MLLAQGCGQPEEKRLNTAWSIQMKNARLSGDEREYYRETDASTVMEGWQTYTGID